MSPAPAEIDVFSRPHSRIKRLVDIYSNRLSATDFSNYTDLKAFLCSLKLTFKEFKTHEKIENECIMEKLKNRLTYHKVTVQEVAEVHSDDCLGKMNRLVEDGCQRTDSCCQSRDEMVLIGNQLAVALRKFTAGFLPHMQEEEEIFQPLLMKYFTYDELKEIRGDVLHKHSMFMTPSWDEKLDEEVECQDKLSEEELLPAPVQLLPSEVTHKIFSYLSPKDLSRCQRVCLQWQLHARDPSLWKTLHPVAWACGDWRFRIPSEELGPDEEEGDMEEEGGHRTVTVDEDADLDESGSSGDSDGPGGRDPDSGPNRVRREARMLTAIVKHLLPTVGGGVEVIDLARSKSVTNGLVYKILQQAPNIRHLNLSLTKISDIGFKGLLRYRSCSKLERLDLSGCVNITDVTLIRFGGAFLGRHHRHDAGEDNTGAQPKSGRFDKNGKPKRSAACPPGGGRETGGDCDGATVCPDCGGVREEGSSKARSGACTAIETDERRDIDPCRPERKALTFLSLSGCYKITDHGLRALLDAGPYPSLRHLDLSGCLQVTAKGLSEFVKACESLNHEEFFYCDNILEGPYAQTASGCQNLECSNRVCCRSGE